MNYATDSPMRAGSAFRRGGRRPARHAPRPPRRGAALTLATLLALPTTALARPAASGSPAHDHRVERRVVVMTGEPGARQLLLGGPSLSRTFLGIQLVGLTPELCKHFAVASSHAVMVSRVEEGSPAALAGLGVGDVISRIDDHPVGSASQLAREIALRKPGDTVTLEVWRDGRASSLSATLGERERAQIDVGPLVWRWEGGEGDPPPFGLLPGPEGGLELEVETLGEAMGHLEEHFDSPQFQGRMRFFQENGSAMLERLEQLEKRLQELEQELERLPEGKR